ncbi:MULTISPECIES: hypothetical protein [Methylococcus]|uniref:DUF4440 domain-containing protein n=1 Tax=Methylococcus capsulatus TaxID=414 RepID=A0ABZ2F5N0_METCP|nr:MULTISPECIES: hypothetical protein [Methylococcus]
MRDHRYARYRFALCLLLALAGGSNAFADWTGLAQYGAVAEISVEPDAVDMDIRIKERVFTNLAGADGGPLLPGLLRLKDKNGHPLEGRIVSFAKPDAVPGKTDGPCYEARLRFDITGKPDALILVPAAQLGKELGVVVNHRGVPLADLGALEAPARILLDWNDPWRSRFEDSGRIRRHSAPRSFLYVEPYEVRHEVLLRLADLAPYLRFKPRDPQNLSLGEREFLKQAAGDFLRTRNPLRINGAVVEAQLDRVEFLRFDRQGMRKTGDSEPLSPASALVGAILVHLTETPAEAVELQWELFGPGLGRRPVTLYSGQESFESEATPRDPVFRWSAEEALGLSPEVERPETRAEAFPRSQVQNRLEALLHNVYRAYALRGEEACYDRLALSLDGSLLEEVYLRQRKAVLARNQGLGGEGRISRVEVLEDGLATRKLGPSSFEVTARWIAHGTVSHWGHSHDRHTLYAARMVLNITEDGTWKITAMDLLEDSPSAASARS